MVYDTTLRDGTQGEDINFTAQEKIRIAVRLDESGFHYIEGGWPGSNPRDDKFFELAATMSFKNAKVVAFGSTRRTRTKAENDKTLKALLDAGTKATAIFGKSDQLHVERVMGNTLAQNLKMIGESVDFLAAAGRQVFYDAEHFFDGYKRNHQYALETLKAAVDGGASFIVLCDTNGGSLPHEVEHICARVRDSLAQWDSNPAVRIGIHTHNDCGLAVANTIAAVRTGATLVQGTINGYGERCGNADLTSIVPILQVKMGLNCLGEQNLTGLRRLSRYVSEAANMTPLNSRPFVGESAFAHKGGVHVSAVTKAPQAYEHMDPALVGNRRRVLISDLAGKSNIEYKAKELGIDLNGGANGLDAGAVVQEIKKMEHAGYQYDAAEASFELLLKRKLKLLAAPFEFESFLVTIRKEKDQPCCSEATIKIVVNGQERFTAAQGAGPVSALDNALRRALRRFYPDVLDAIRLVDYKVRVLDGRDGTAAKVKVFIESRDSENIWKTIGVSEDIIEASWQALADSVQYPLSKVLAQNNNCGE
ncbi:MAG: citramalate synthase [Desulfatibacillaceae bacterium]|nr:citramalate synthase [Desulfatibacillaceae bacterium]